MKTLLLTLALSASLFAGEKPLQGTIKLDVLEGGQEVLPNGIVRLTARARMLAVNGVPAKPDVIVNLACMASEGRKHCAPLVPGEITLETHAKDLHSPADLTTPGQELHYRIVGSSRGR